MKPVTRADHEAALEQLGLTGGALEAAVGALGRLRHESRVRAAAEAALRAAGGDSCGAAAILLSDEYIRQTDRHPALAGLGKGRRKAADGPAWSAAIVAAGYELCGLHGHSVQWEARDGRAIFGKNDVTDLIPPWVRAQLAGCRLANAIACENRRLCSQWAAAYNAALEEGQLDPHTADFGELCLPGTPLPDACEPVEDVFADVED